MIFYIRTWLYIRRRRLCRIDPIVWWTIVHDLWVIGTCLVLAGVFGLVLEALLR